VHARMTCLRLSAPRRATNPLVAPSTAHRTRLTTEPARLRRRPRTRRPTLRLLSGTHGALSTDCTTFTADTPVPGPIHTPHHTCARARLG